MASTSKHLNGGGGGGSSSGKLKSSHKSSKMSKISSKSRGLVDLNGNDGTGNNMISNKLQSSQTQQHQMPSLNMSGNSQNHISSNLLHNSSSGGLDLNHQASFRGSQLAAAAAANNFYSQHASTAAAAPLLANQLNSYFPGPGASQGQNQQTSMTPYGNPVDLLNPTASYFMNLNNPNAAAAADFLFNGHHVAAAAAATSTHQFKPNSLNSLGSFNPSIANSYMNLNANSNQT